MSNSAHDRALGRYRGWIYDTAGYNLVWGAANVFFPLLVFDLLAKPHPHYTAVWQVVGMFVLAYAPAYWWAARFPDRHRQIVLVGLAGKILGPIGFVRALANGSLPALFGWTILTNDLIWWPVFAPYLRDVAARAGGAAALLGGEIYGGDQVQLDFAAVDRSPATCYTVACRTGIVRQCPWRRADV